MSEDSYAFPRHISSAPSAAPWVVARRASVRPAAFGSTEKKRSRPPTKLTSVPPPPPAGLSELPLPAPSTAVFDTPPPGSGSMLPPQPRALSVELEAELSTRIEAYATAAVELTAARERALEEVEGQLLALAVDIAEALVEAELHSDPELHGRLARSAVSALKRADGARLRASAQAYDAITEAYGGPSVEVDGVTVVVHVDPSLDGLGCVAENEGGSVDGRIGERLAAVRRALEDERRERAEQEQNA